MGENAATANKQSTDSGSSGGGCCGCFTIPLLFIALWALIFGVTVDGKHYGLKGCSFDNGVEIDR